MSELLTLLLAVGAGVLFGLFYFALLWWTVVRGLRADNPALWFLGSWWVRASFLVAGFYLVSGRDWRIWVMCMLGFQLARLHSARMSRLVPEGVNHAP